MTDQQQPVRRVVVVTGASRGIGRAIALRLADPRRAARHVVLVSRSEAPLQDVRAAIEASGGSASVAAIDVADAKALQAGMDAIAEKHGRLDILVNNAGITKDGLALRMSDEDWDLVLDTNLKSAFIATRAAARHMMRGRFGRIVNISSTSGVVGNAGQANYAAAKAGMIGLTKSIAKELGAKGITCNALAPGFITTDMTENLPANIKEELQKMIAVRRLGTPEDIAAGVEYLTSEDAGFLSGQCLVIDGGMTMA